MKRKKIDMAIGLITIMSGCSLMAAVVPQEQSKAIEKTVKIAETAELEESNLYSIGSTSKMFVTVAVMQLVGEGKIDLDRPLVNYMIDFKMADPRYVDITPRMLLNHSSGLMGSTYKNTILLEDNASYAHDELLNQLQSRRLKAEPGKYPVYCNDGFTLAEILVERVSKMSFTEYLNTYIFKPLNMKNSGTPINYFENKRQTKTYFNREIEIATDYGNIIGSGGILSTTEDLCKFSSIFMANNNTFLSEDSKKALGESEYEKMSYGYVEGDTNNNYGLGWDSVELYPFKGYGIKALQKGGDLWYQHGNLTVLPEQNMSVAVLTSGGSSTFNALVAQELLELTLEEKGVIEETASYEPVKGTITTAIPESELSNKGIYVSEDKIYKVSFPKKEYLELTLCEETIEKTQIYYYTEEGYYITKDDGYINRAGLVEAEEGAKGSSKVFFKKETDGNCYLAATIYENYTNLGTSASTTPLAQRMKPEEVSQTVLDAWKKREDNKYYLCSEKYSSALWLGGAHLEINLSDILPGYIKGFSRMYTVKMVDELHAMSPIALPGTVGRDLNDIEVEYIKGNETIHLLDTDASYISEKAVESMNTTSLTVKLEEEEARWFKIDESIQREQVKVDLKGNAAIYVYNHYDECIYTSYMKNNGNNIILPVDGTIVIVGEKGSEVTLN